MIKKIYINVYIIKLSLNGILGKSRHLSYEVYTFPKYSNKIITNYKVRWVKHKNMDAIFML